MKHKTKIIATICIAMMMLVSACSNNGANTNSTGTEEGTANTAKVANIGVSFAPSNINPLQPVGLVSTYVSNLLFIPLVEVDKNLQYQPMLADSITTEDNQTFLVNLNQAAAWTDGTDITADDVIFTLELMSNPVIASNYAYMFGIIEGLDANGYLPESSESISGVQKINDDTISIKTKQPTTLTIFQDTVGRYLLTLPKAQLENIAPEDVNKSEFIMNPSVTSGPFTLSAINRDQFVEMKANKQYFKGEPKLDQLNFKVMQGTAIAAQLKSGEIDMNIPSAGVIPVSEHELVSKLDHVTTSYGQPLSSPFIYINENVVSDAKQRQAISYAIDRELMVNQLLKGAGEITNDFFTSISPYKNKEVAIINHDPEKAKQLLTESGWDSNKTLKLAVLSGDSTLEQAANIMVQNLSEVGIKASIEMMDLGTIIDRLSNLNYDLGLLPVSIVPVNPLPDIAYFVGEGNPTAYNNARVTEIVNALSTEVDEVKLKALYDELQVIIAQDVPMPSLYATTALGAVNERIIGAEPSDFGMFINVHEWDIKQ